MSQLDGETKDIDGHKYTVYMLPPMTSHELLVDVSKMIGPALGPLIDGAQQQSDGLNYRALFDRAAQALFSGLDKAVLRALIDKMSEVSHVDGKPLKPIFDGHFRGRLDWLYAWLAFAMKVQWGKPLSALTSRLGGQGASPSAQA